MYVYMIQRSKQHDPCFFRKSHHDPITSPYVFHYKVGPPVIYLLVYKLHEL